jgi:tol-pal system protein YbgF
MSHSAFSLAVLARRAGAFLIAAGLLAGAASSPALAQDPTDLLLRTNRLEGQVRQLSGQIEQLQFENRRLQEQLKRFQEDVEFRLQERGGARSPSGTTPNAAPPARRGDAFDPSAQPQAPGQPRNLAGGGAGGAPRGAIEGIIAEDGAQGGAGSQPLDLSGAARAPSVSRPSIAATGNASPRETYDAAFALFQQKQFEAAEMGFRQFLQSHPRDALVPDAIFFLGDSYLQRGRHREAAEQFLKVSTDFPRAARAPDALLKLGTSLNALGARDQACATLAKAERDYPRAGDPFRQRLDREQRRIRCTG